ncbi:MAG: OmpA family protein [Burkholderiaceae bacterium]|nr:OmpA family protein [Burkholderiaceae bacterium]
MHPTSPPAADAVGSRIVDRHDGDRSLAGRIVPLLALSVLAALTVQSCLTPTPPATSMSPPAFDVAAAERRANDAALKALAGLPADARADQVIAALNLGVVNFAIGSSDVPPSAAPLLDAAARAIVALPAGTRVALIGHTDNRGPQEANMALSRQRADAVRQALSARGVAAERLVASGAGDARPLASNATDEGRFTNRRIEFAVAP